ncbi:MULTISPECIES: nucleoside kinase [Thermotoga]|jgi:uridine kinase|uniref:Uridine kinase-related protein n=3 Tax=Thermotoga TaxID=2335 RepID=Q9WZL0_THEMA|nr:MULTISPECIES: nucleoside kinase [Thermotoga]KUK23594.1 MAG: Phosphoribulokinase/uridine kinase [Thermotoga petrophila]KUK33969.1 MAG: Phosphoribulokinase/uridine kinase [Thermotoga sp. 47_83]MDK2893684.1 uridine kinase [Thermotoga sp.]AAD35832.1 uridine kinase-related protein [Thermotoga maritima MSB8]ABQ46207.1 phosphoribulokinase/uridine kinase [Thermotoga petrophila RKU-1]
MRKITLRSKLDGREIVFEENQNLFDIAREYQKYYRYKILAARVNNRIIELFRTPDRSGELEFLDLTDPDGLRIYQRGLVFLASLAVRKLNSEWRLKVLHSLGKGIYCEIYKGNELIVPDQNQVFAIKDKMRELVEKDLPIEKRTFYKDEAREILMKEGLVKTVNLFKYRKKRTVKLYHCDGFWAYFYGYLPPSTGRIDVFDVQPYNQGLVLVHPDPKTRELPVIHMPKLSQVFLEYARWLNVLELEYVSDLNDIIARGERHVADLMLLSEALHEKKISDIADEIAKDKRKRLILIAGPSSSGKTTFAKRLSLQLRVNGLKPVAISLDDYFVDREKTPRDENGNYDFDSIEALDIELFNRNLQDLLAGKEVVLPKFNFKTGKRMRGPTLKLEKDNIIIVEGIHGLNERLTASIPKEQKFKIYVSALTQLNIDDHNRVTTTDTRLIRRIVRDYKFRGHTAYDTLKMWPNVRKGEERNIFPFQEEADVMFNSALVYEIPVLRIFAEPLLVQVPEDVPEYSEALRLLKLLDFFLPITNIEDIPDKSILREFIGRSIFKY